MKKLMTLATMVLLSVGCQTTYQPVEQGSTIDGTGYVLDGTDINYQCRGVGEAKCLELAERVIKDKCTSAGYKINDQKIDVRYEKYSRKNMRSILPEVDYMKYTDVNLSFVCD
jgi:hypothetical protein